MDDITDIKIKQAEMKTTLEGTKSHLNEAWSHIDNIKKDVAVKYEYLKDYTDEKVEKESDKVDKKIDEMEKSVNTSISGLSAKINKMPVELAKTISIILGIFGGVASLIFGGVQWFLNK